MRPELVIATACVAVGLWLHGWSLGRWALWRRMRRLRRPRTVAIVLDERLVGWAEEREQATERGEFRTVPHTVGGGVDVLN